MTSSKTRKQYWSCVYPTARTCQIPCWDLEAAAEVALGDSVRVLCPVARKLPCKLGCELTLSKSFAGKKAAVFSQAGIEILKKLLPFSDLVTVNCDNFAWK